MAANSSSAAGVPPRPWLGGPQLRARVLMLSSTIRNFRMFETLRDRGVGFVKPEENFSAMKYPGRSLERSNETDQVGCQQTASWYADHQINVARQPVKAVDDQWLHIGDRTDSALSH